MTPSMYVYPRLQPRWFVVPGVLDRQRRDEPKTRAICCLGAFFVIKLRRSRPMYLCQVT